VAIAPILIALAAVRWLGEKAPPGTGVSLVLSFLGVLLIVRPGTALFGWAAVLPLATAMFVTGYQLLTRRLNGEDDGVATLFIGAVVVTVVLSAIRIGAIATIEVASASGMCAMAPKKHNDEVPRQSPRSTCRSGRRVMRSRRP